MAGIFDYNTLNAYLLTAIGIAQPNEEHRARYESMAKKAAEGKPIPLRDIRDLGRKDPVTFLPESANLSR